MANPKIETNWSWDKKNLAEYTKAELIGILEKLGKSANCRGRLSGNIIKTVIKGQSA